MNKHYLFLNRLVILNTKGIPVYDELFHKGVNIIRGNNSSGKSTISNFIYYVLGGDFENWTNEAKKCQFVIAELNINGQILTIKRELHISKASMHIYLGEYDKACNNTFGWETYKYSMSAEQLSFSNKLFEYLNYPITKGESSNITMNQILRLLYIDQQTQYRFLLKDISFDSNSIRQVIAELLLGYYNDELYDIRQELKNKQKDIASQKSELTVLKKLINQSSEFKDRKTLEEKINKLEEELSSLDISIKDSNKALVTNPKKKESVEIYDEVIKLKDYCFKLKDIISTLNSSNEDSRYFILSLQEKKNALSQTLNIKKLFEDIHITNCPQCLSKLSRTVNENSCFLCTQPLNKDKTVYNSNNIRYIQEINFQIQESTKILDQNKVLIEQYSDNLKERNKELKLSQAQLSLYKENNSPIDVQNLQNLYARRGGLEMQLRYLNKDLITFDLRKKLEDNISNLTKSIVTLETAEDNLEEQEESRKEEIYKAIECKVVSILQKDIDSESKFKNAQKLEIDFSNNKYFLDGNSNFSASSNALLKNAILFGIFFATLEKEYSRYPRFILCDNIEDKGMQEERSKNFQRIIVEMSKDTTVEHQIIFTTSMIDEGLNTSEYCVGDFYTVDNKSLKI